jgi:tRNA G18 (ribose-2'-O)-methylase SpoU
MPAFMPIHITHPDDPQIEAYRDIRERDLVGRQGRFIVEGRVTLGVLIERGRYEIESVLVGESRLEPLHDLLAKVPDDVPVYAASQPVLDAIAGFPMHRGVLAVARKPEALPLEAIIAPREKPQALLALIGLSNHDNVGACFRNAAALGASGVITDAASADPFYRKAIRVSAGTVLWMPQARVEGWRALFDALEAAGHRVLALTPDLAATDLRDFAPPDRFTLVLGAEGPGLPKEAIARATALRIPMADGVDSLNVATAGAVALSHLATRLDRKSVV